MLPALDPRTLFQLAQAADTPDESFELPASVEELKELLQSWGEFIAEAVQSVPFLAQVGAIIVLAMVAPIVTAVLRRRISILREEPIEGRLLPIQQLVFRLRATLLPAVYAILLLAAATAFAAIPVLGRDWLLRLVLGLSLVVALFRGICELVPNPLARKLVLWTVIPTAVMSVFGIFDEFVAFLEGTDVQAGSIRISAAMVARTIVFGTLLYWVGRISNQKGQAAIRSQESIDKGTREVIAKIFEFAVFALLAFLLMNIAGIDLSALVVVGGAVGLGLGFGLQQIAANFISGVILLLDRSLLIGDFVVLPDGREGYVAALNMRSATVETTDGKDIMVPNIKFIEDAYENWTHKDPRQRYEVYFSVTFDTDIDTLEDLLIPAISAHPKVLQEPEKPDLELRSFGEFGINFAIEFWVEGIDDGENKFTSDLNFIIWRTLRQHGVKMPLPQREVRILDAKRSAAAINVSGTNE